MISVIIPVYNASQTIERAIDSILVQTYQDFELILVDDGSTDESGSICDRYAREDARIRVFHKQNGGANSARNVGLDQMHGDYVAFCDADDYVDEDWLQSFVDCFGDADVVIQGWKYVRDNVESIYYANTPSDPALAADVMSGMESFGFLVTKCFKTDIIHKNRLRFNECFRFLEDEEFVCRYWNQISSVRFVRCAAYNYIVPDFSQKYANIDNYGLYVSLIDHASQFIEYPDSVTMRKYTMGMFRCMLLAFEQRRYADGWIRLKEFAQYGERFHPYNKYMKWIKNWNYPLWYTLLIVYMFVKAR